MPISGLTRVDLILEEIRQYLLARGLQARLDEQHPLRQVVTMLADATPPWEQRLGLLRHIVLPHVPILLVLDNAEDLLTADGSTWTLTDDQLAAFLATCYYSSERGWPPTSVYARFRCAASSLSRAGRRQSSLRVSASDRGPR